MALPSIPGYELGALLGQGGMGAVYAAHQHALQRTVAVKFLHAALASDPTLVERFRQEALAASRVVSPHVVTVIDVGTATDGAPYVVMEHVAGERLGAIIEREGALEPGRACDLVEQLLAALEATHAAGIVHADVKSDNVMVSRGVDGREHVTLIDFGIARVLDLEGEAEDPENRVLSGTAEYLAPEVIAGEPTTAAADVYAAGVVLYELLTGTPPFRGASSAEVLHMHLEDDPVAPSLRAPGAEIAPMLERVVLRALAKDPATRHASAAV